MKSRFISFLFGAALMCQVATPNTLRTVAKVPFAFTVDSTSVPAGEYTFKESNGVLAVSSESDHKTFMVLTMAASRSRSTPEGRLQFVRYGDEYYLTNLWTGGETAGQWILPGKRQKELAKEYQSGTVVETSLHTSLR